jgi:very-short-patch-repair endonuclease
VKRHPILKANARQLRRDMTTAETALWRILRGKKLGGFKFRRQHPIEPYIADFCCLSVKLVVELDGDSHNTEEKRDYRRDEVLQNSGYATLRFRNSEVFDRPDWVAEMILGACQEHCKKE